MGSLRHASSQHGAMKAKKGRKAKSRTDRRRSTQRTGGCLRCVCVCVCVLSRPKAAFTEMQQWFVCVCVCVGGGGPGLLFLENGGLLTAEAWKGSCRVTHIDDD